MRIIRPDANILMISKKDVERIARLARIALGEEEKKNLGKDISSILGFVETLNAINTEHVDPMTGGTMLENAMREDEAPSSDLEGKSSNLMEAAPKTHKGWVRVESVFEKNQ